MKWMMTQADTKRVRNTFQEYRKVTYKVFRLQKGIDSYELLENTTKTFIRWMGNKTKYLKY